MPAGKLVTGIHTFYLVKLCKPYQVFCRSGSNLLSIGGAAVITVVGGSVALAKVNDGFRKVAESYVPGSTELFKAVLGPSVPHIPVVENKHRYNKSYLLCIFSDDDVYSSISDGLMKKKLEREAAKRDGGMPVLSNLVMETLWYSEIFLDLLIVKSSEDPSLETPKLSADFLPPIEAPSETSKVVEPVFENAVTPVEPDFIDQAKVEDKFKMLFLLFLTCWVPQESTTDVADAEQCPPSTENNFVADAEVDKTSVHNQLASYLWIFLQASDSLSINITNIYPGDFARLIGELRNKATDAVNEAVTAQEAAAAAIKSSLSVSPSMILSRDVLF